MKNLFRIILNNEYWRYENNDKKWTKQRKQTMVMLLKQLLFHLFLFKYIQYKWIWTSIHIVIWTILIVVNIFLNCLNDVEWWVYEIYQFVCFVLFSLFLLNIFCYFILCDLYNILSVDNSFMLLKTNIQSGMCKYFLKINNFCGKVKIPVFWIFFIKKVI